MTTKNGTTAVQGTIKEEKEESSNGRKNITMEAFLSVYLDKTNETYEDVARVLRVKVTTISQRVYNYQKRGINIVPKSGGRGARKLDVDKANAIIASCS